MAVENPIVGAMEGEQKVHDHCGIMGVVAPEGNALDIGITALLHLNHRGHEGSGISLVSPEGIITHKDKGYVIDVFTPPVIAELSKNRYVLACGQNRYSTSGTPEAWQPFTGYFNAVSEPVPFSITHNGNITNAMVLFGRLPPDLTSGVANDTDILSRFISVSAGGEKTFQDRLKNVLPNVEGAAGLIIMTNKEIFAYRDPWGFRPLTIGQIDDGVSARSYVVASETCALNQVKAKPIRDVLPGEGVKIDKNGIETFFLDPRLDKVKLARCIFELVYISSPDSVVFGKSVSSVRERIGALLASEDLEAGFIPEVIIPVQFSGIGYATGYASEMIKQVVRDPERFDISSEQLPDVVAGLQTQTGLVVNAYASGRAFISNGDRAGVTVRKHRADKQIINGKRVVVLDDSLIRGDASNYYVRALKNAGAREVHVRIGCPPYGFPCKMGVDTPNPNKLIINKVKTVEGVRQYIGSDSLRYATHQDLLQAVSGENQEPGMSDREIYQLFGFCAACLTGAYPLDTSGVYSKEV